MIDMQHHHMFSSPGFAGKYPIHIKFPDMNNWDGKNSGSLTQCIDMALTNRPSSAHYQPDHQPIYLYCPGPLCVKKV